MAKLNIIDLFSGCGGLLDGFLQSNHYNSIAGIEWEKYPCETLRKRLQKKWGHKNADKEVILFDIQRTEEFLNGFSDDEYGNSEGLLNIIGKKSIDVIIGGPPCQAYSLAGRIRDPNGMRDDYRNYLFESYIEVLNAVKPRFFIFENVVGLLSAAPTGFPITKIITKAFKEAGYIITPDLKTAVFDVADFGIPQHRKRVIILGVRSDVLEKEGNENLLYDFYNHYIPSFRTKIMTVQEALGDLPPFFPMEEPVKKNGVHYSHEPFSSEISNHIPRFHNKRDIGIFKFLAEDIEFERYEYVSTEKLKELYTRLTGKKSNIHKYYVLRRNEPSNTIPAHLFKDGMRHIHPDSQQARSITVREAARLQTFDDDFVFEGPMMAQYKMIGNAVPPKFAKVIAEALYKLIQNIK